MIHWAHSSFSVWVDGGSSWPLPSSVKNRGKSLGDTSILRHRCFPCLWWQCDGISSINKPFCCFGTSCRKMDGMQLQSWGRSLQQQNILCQWAEWKVYVPQVSFEERVPTIKTSFCLLGFSAEFLRLLASTTDDESEYWQSLPSGEKDDGKRASFAVGQASWMRGELYQLDHRYEVLHLWKRMHGNCPSRKTGQRFF